MPYSICRHSVYVAIQCGNRRKFHVLGLLQDIIALKSWCQPSAMLELRGRRRAVTYSVLNARNGDIHGMATECRHSVHIPLFYYCVRSASILSGLINPIIIECYDRLHTERCKSIYVLRTIAREYYTCVRDYYTCTRVFYTCARDYYTCVRDYYTCARDYYSGQTFLWVL